MSAPVGDLLGITCVFMPSGFVTATPEPTPTVDFGGPVSVAEPRRAVAVYAAARVRVLGAARCSMALAAATVGEFRVAGDVRPAVFRGAIQAQASIAMAATAEATIWLQCDARSVRYNEDEALLLLVAGEDS